MQRAPMRKLLAVLPLCLLCGCAADSDAAQAGGIFWQYLKGTKVKVTREQAAAVPYASMGLELGSSPQTLLVLGTAMEGELDWYAGDQVFVATRQGRVIRTGGLPYDLGGLRLAPPNPSNMTGTPGPGPVSVQFFMDFPDLGVFGAPAQCSVTDAGDSPAEIFGASLPTRRIVEHCTVPVLKWSFDNEYWADRMTGYIWRSSQYIHPKSPPIVLEVFRPEERGSG